MDPRIFLYALIGCAIAGVVALEKRIANLPISLPILFIGLGWAVFSLPLDLGWLNPAFDTKLAEATEYVTELIVIVSLMGVGLSIDRKCSWKEWKQVAPLLWLTMPLCIAGVGLMGWAWLGLAPAAALLLGACLAPTDPVMAGAVQVGPPGESGRDDVRFNLSAEAGLNDGLAFPFVHLAIALSAASFDAVLLGRWAGMDVFWRIIAGCGVGWLTGRGISWFAFRGDGSVNGSVHHEGREGLLVIAALFIAYGVAEMVGGYGFLAVFTGAVTARQLEHGHELHKRTHGFIDQVESVVLVAVLIFFGGLLASGVLNALTWWSALLGIVFVTILRPIAGALAMCGSNLPWQSRWAVGFLGIRGIGSIYYLSYGQMHGEFEELNTLWSAAAFVILLSVLIHGVSSAALIRYLAERGLSKKPGQDDTVM